MTTSPHAPRHRPHVGLLALPLLLVSAVAAALGGCTPAQKTPAKPPVAQPAAPSAPDARGDRPFFRGTPAMRQDIRDLFARVEGAPPHLWADTARKLVSYGEPAVPHMISHLQSSVTDVQVMAAYALGMIEDPRALPALEEATRSPKGNVRNEAAAAMLRMGDRRGLVPMIDALEDPDPLVRARAILVLQDQTGETLGYKADDKPVDRGAAVARWRAWLARTGGTIRAKG